MKKTKILSSAFIMTMVSFGAFAADKTITEASTCTVDVLGTSDNNATANAIATWTLNEYTLNPGQYLNVTETSVDKVTCPAGSYCVGGTGFTVDNAQTSIAQCPTGYPNSANGASADTQCYTACTVANANIAHATAVTGNDYYGSGVDTCGATACETGWHVESGVDLIGMVTSGPSERMGFVNDNLVFEEWIEKGGLGQEYYGISDRNSFAADFAEGIIMGHGRCSTQEGTNNDRTWTDPTIVNTLTDETGMEGAKYCYCTLDGYRSKSGKYTPITFVPWVFYNDEGSETGCASRCFQACGAVLFYSPDSYQTAMLRRLRNLPATCAANTINIDWNPDNNGAHTINQCTYEGAIEVPADPVKPGYTFMGWKLLENTTTE